jgi:serine phosphatase RsbU (regulator of sigma subunit)/Tfp pilus assembly protein PilF
MKLKNYYSIFIGVFLILISLTSRAQNYDSIWKIWYNTKLHDTIRLDALYTLSWEGTLFSDPDSSFKLAQMQYDYAKKKGYKIYEAQALNTQGVYFYFSGDLDQAEKKYLQSLAIKEEINDQLGIAGTTGNLGLIYYSKGNNIKAIEYYLKSLKMQEILGNYNGIANALNNIGNVYASINESDKAIEYYLKCLKIYEDNKDLRGIGSTNNNLGGIYIDKKQYEKAVPYLEKALTIRRQIDEKNGIAETLNNLGTAYYNFKKYPESRAYFLESKEIRELTNDKSGKAAVLKNMANLEITLKNYSKAIELANEALKYAKETETILEIRDAYESLFLSYKAIGKDKLALESYVNYITFKDSIVNEDNKWSVIQKSFEYDQEIIDAADSVKRMEEIKVTEALIAKQNAEARQKDIEIKSRKNFQLVLTIGLILIALVAIFIFNRLRLIRKQKSVIELQKTEVERQREFAIEQKNIAEEQRNIVEEKNQEIADSINYAKRIQDAILPSRNALIENLKNGFVLFKPKDIVSGDFYWLEKLNNTIYFAAADCTGHGVPGAMVSVVCSNALSKALLEDEVEEPGKILDRTRELVIQRFSKSDEEVKDGMDISLVSLTTGNFNESNQPSTLLQWAGANNPIWIINPNRSQWPDSMVLFGDSKGAEFKPDSQPIGKYESQSPFKTHQIVLEKGDTIYVFTDGYQDQFGGEKGKKLKSIALKNILVSLYHLPMDEQKEQLEIEFNKWKGSLEQIDDVCIIGVRM